MPATNDPRLPVLDVLPFVFTAQSGINRYDPQLRQTYYRDEHSGLCVFKHHCPHCGGWIDGQYNVEQDGVRQGLSYSCRRCGREIAFVGAVS